MDRSPPFHGGSTGSNPVEVTKADLKKSAFLFIVVVYKAFIGLS